MFDNPKKELERLEQQLLAVEAPGEEDFDVLPDADDIPDDTLHTMLNDDRAFSRRSAGFDIPDDTYEMDTDRYVPAPRKKRRGGLLLFACLVLALIAWRMGWLG